MKKKSVILAIITASALLTFTACGPEINEASVSEAIDSKVSEIKETVNSQVSEVFESVKENVSDNVESGISEAIESVKDEVGENINLDDIKLPDGIELPEGVELPDAEAIESFINQVSEATGQ